ncbi:MAG TPA: ParB/RepB/Spo0J family partition protein [Anaeromyxobacter sp.]|nr:ParB/RepB/Spo0J family partition protein [Anaeromyxobacter sp.]
MELEPRTTAPAHATGAVRFVPLSELSDDATFRLRDEGDIAPLAASIGRLGQLVPVEVRPLPGTPAGGPPLQLVAGFRRVAAVRMLARDRILARVHETLDDDDAWGIALTQALLAEPLLASELEALRERLAAAGRAAWAEEVLPDALARAPVDPRLRERFLEWAERASSGAETAEDAAGEEPEASEETEPGGEAASGEATVEVTPEDLARELAQRMYEVNQDLALAFASWADLPREGRRMIVEQARYVAELLAHLEDRR